MTDSDYLQPGAFVDSDHPAVRAFAHKHAKGDTPRERAVSLYYAVRDGVRYNPFLNFQDPETYRASSVLARGVGFCVGKSALYAACARAIGIPARVGFADVRNHLTTPRLRALLRATPRILFVAALVVFAAYSLQLRVFEPGWGRGGILSWWPVTFSGSPLVFFPLGLRWMLDYMRTEAPVFFMGTIREGFIPGYFPAVFAVKVPLGLSLLPLVALAARLRARRLGSRELGIALAFLAVFAVVVPTWLHVGLRHILPAVVLAVLGAASLLDPALPWRRLRRVVAAAGLAWCAGSTLRCAPHFLAHFNEVAGGPGGGWRCLADSNLDWGQDLPALARWMKAQGIAEIPLIYFGTADPGWHGVRIAKANPESPGWKGGLVAISVSYADGTLTGDLDRFGWARTLTPVARPGWSIHVYDVPPPTPPRSRPVPAGTAPGSR